MKLGTRIFFCYLLIFSVCFYYPISWIVDNLRTRYLEGIEDSLVDQATIMASIISNEMERNAFEPDKLYTAFENVYNQQLSAPIYKVTKTNVDMYIYITDTSGKIIFDSANRDNIGKDYSKWRDVKLTLEGEYGTRTTKKFKNVPTSSVLYIAAPLLVKGTIAGVLTVAKPTTYVNNFLKKAKPQILKIVTLAGIIAIFLIYIVSLWLTLPIRRMTSYAIDISKGKRARFPNLHNDEIGRMGIAFENMQEALEGKKYVEQYVQTLTHEIKSPLSAIRGAAELLEEKMSPDRRTRFLSNIHNEANRIQDLVDRMLELSTLENKKILHKQENISFHSLIKTILESKRPILSKKGITIVNKVTEGIFIQGDSFLLHQAISNLIQNAIDFSQVHSRIELSSSVGDKFLEFKVMDNGSGIPDFAVNKIFNKFFSLPRSENGKKSTGLGLNFVKEVAMLHHGHISLANRPEGGVCASLGLPL